MRTCSALVAVATVAIFAGCSSEKPTSPASAGVPGTPQDEIATERANLSPEDRSLVDAQEWCVVSNDERLGAMGPPLKLDIKGQPVFVCCKGCKRKAEADPDKTLAKLAELKLKKTAGASR